MLTDKLHFLILGNSNWCGLPNRDQHIAYHLAESGNKVIFVNEIPSLAKRVSSFLNSGKKCFSFYQSIPNTLKIITPPLIPTFFRSSYTPHLDKRIIQHWFKKIVSPQILRNAVVVITTPVWFYLLDNELNEFPFIIYDICDDLNVSARNRGALRYLISSEEIGVLKANLITCSSPVLQKYIADRYGMKTLLVRNGVSGSFQFNVKNERSTEIIGLAGTLTVKPAIYDIDLIIKVAADNPECEVRIAGNIPGRVYLKFKRQPNINCTGICGGAEMRDQIAQFTVCLIPFLSGQIVNSINPLKLYEYLVQGKPVIATDNFDYENAGQLIYPARNHVEFLNSVRIALCEHDLQKREDRVNWALSRNWGARAEYLLENIRESLNSE